MITIDESLDQITLSSYTPNTFLYVGTGGLLTPTAAPTNGQILIGSTGAAPTIGSISASSGISVTNSAGGISIANTGVTSLTSGNSSLNVSSSTGAITITNNNGTCGTITAAGTTQGTAATLTYAYNIVNAGSGGVIFPTPTAAGQMISVENRSGGNLNVYPNVGGQIETLGTNVASAMGDGSCFNFISSSTLQWYHTTIVTGQGAGISITNSTAGDTAVKTFTNTGVLSIAGTTNQITASASTGAVTLSLPTTVITGSYEANSSISASTNLGLFSTATTLGFTDSEVFMSGVDSVNSYVQSCMQNTNAGTAASADFIVNNNLSTATTYYGDFGINSSAYTGSGSLNLPNATYLVSQNGDLTLGTQTSNAIHFVINGSTVDVMTISTAGVVNIGSVGGTNGVLSFDGLTSGTITIQPQATAGTYNFNLPTTAGSAGQVLTSQGGGSAAMTWTSLGSSAVTSFSAGTTGLTPSSATTGAITLAGTLAIANGGTGQTTAAAARGPNGLNIDERTTFSNTNYTCLSTDRYVAQVGTLTTPVTITLPAANSVNPGQTIYIADESGTVSGSNYFTVAPSGTNNLNGVNASKTFRTPYQRVQLVSDGASNWYYELFGLAQGGTGTGTIFTQGSIVFAGAGGVYSQDNANIFWDDTNYRLGIGIASPSYMLQAKSKSGSPAQIFASNNDFVNGSTGSGYYLSTSASSGNTYTNLQSFQSGNSATGNLLINAVSGSGNVGIGTPAGQLSTALLTVGGTSANTVTGSIGLNGNTSGTVIIQPQATAGTYNFNLPTTAGTAGQVLTSQAGGTSAMTWSNTSNIQIFSTAGTATWTAPAGITTVYVFAIGAGGGGGGGARENSGTAGVGGGSGAGGAGVRAYFTASSITSTVTITVGSGGTAGAGATSIGAGTAGGTGGNSSFGTYVTAYGGGGGSSNATGNTAGGGSAGLFGAGGNGVTTTGGAAGSGGGVIGAAGTAAGTANFGAILGNGNGVGNAINQAGVTGAAGAVTGGGGSGGSTSTSTAFAGGVGGQIIGVAGGSAGSATGGNGGIGTASAALDIGGSGGGGGGANRSGAGGTGGNGIEGSGGGGGGCGSTAGGNGGTGGAGYVVVISW